MKKLNKLIVLTIVSLLCGNHSYAQELEWVKHFGRSSEAYGSSLGAAVALDAQGNVYTVGSFIGVIDFDPGAGIFELTGDEFQEDDNIFVSKLDASGNLVWAKQIEGGGYDYAKSVAVDLQGNVYVTGRFYSIADFDPGDSVFELTSADDGSSFILKLDSEGNFEWVKAINSSNGSYGQSITTDELGNIYTTGNFYGTASVATEEGTINLSSNGNEDVLITKLNTEGNFLWVKGIGGFGLDMGTSIKTDNVGNIYITGFFSGAVNFNQGGEVATNLVSAGNWDAFVAKWNTDGQLHWAKQMSGSDYEVGTAIALDSDYNVYSTGYFRGAADFDPGENTSTITPNGDRDIYVLKLSEEGDFLWVKQMGGSAGDVGYSIATDAAGNVYTTGIFRNTVDFDPGNGEFNMVSAAFDDAFISKLNSSGEFVWAKQIGGTGNEVIESIVIDNAGAIHTVGTFSSTVDFDPGPAVFELSVVGSSAFVHKMSVAVGINELSSSSAFVFPNPTNSFITIQAVAPIKSIAIYNLLGELIQTETRSSFSIEHLPAGVYMVQVETKNAISTNRVIKQ